LNGPLGSGKTTMIKGIARGLGVHEMVTSPSFTILTEYEGNIPFYHMDLYRIGSVEEFEYLGTEDILYGEGVTVIEWAEKAEGFLPDEKTVVNIELIGHNERSIHIRLKN
jgi:tRNA threonylcarbamoyladenosine biosynthesis protein TsaE